MNAADSPQAIRNSQMTDRQLYNVFGNGVSDRFRSQTLVKDLRFKFALLAHSCNGRFYLYCLRPTLLNLFYSIFYQHNSLISNIRLGVLGFWGFVVVVCGENSINIWME